MSAIWFRIEPQDRHARIVRVYAVALVMAAAAGFIPPAIDLPHRVLHGLHLMAPTCGLGRAGRAVLRLQLSEAVQYNPAVVALVGVSAVLAAREVLGRTAGKWLTFRLRLSHRSIAVIGVAFVALAAWQQYRFDYLIDHA